MQPLDRFIDADPNFDLSRDVIPGVIASGMYKGHVYGFPIYNGPALIFYNPDAFVNRGVVDPAQYVREDRWTRDTFLNVAKKMTYDSDGDGTPNLYGYAGYSTWEPSWVPFVRSSGGDVVGPDGKSSLNTPEVIDGLEWLNNLNVQYNVTNSPGPGGGTWADGNIAMAGRWMTTAMIEKRTFDAFSPEAVLNPKGPAGYAHISGGVPVMVATDTDHPQEAYEFAKWFGTQSRIWRVRGGVPLSWAEIRSDEYQNILSVFKNPDFFEMALSQGDTRPEPEFGIAKYQDMSKVINETLINPIIQGTTTVRAAVEEAHRLLNQVLATK